MLGLILEPGGAIKILRDIADMRNGDRITDFMKDIGEGDRIFIVLSDKVFSLCLLHVRAL